MAHTYKTKAVRILKIISGQFVIRLHCVQQNKSELCRPVICLLDNYITHIKHFYIYHV